MKLADPSSCLPARPAYLPVLSGCPACLSLRPCSPCHPPPNRCDEAASTITLLGGISLLHASPDALHLKLVTAYPTGAVRPGKGGAGDGWCDPGPCAAADHELSVHLQPGGSAGGCWWGRQDCVGCKPARLGAGGNTTSCPALAPA